MYKENENHFRAKIYFGTPLKSRKKRILDKDILTFFYFKDDLLMVLKLIRYFIDRNHHFNKNDNILKNEIQDIR